MSHGDGSYLKLINQIAKADVLIIDDWGLDTLSQSQRNDLLEIMEDRHGNKSTIVTSQLPTNKWHERYLVLLLDSLGVFLVLVS